MADLFDSLHQGNQDGRLHSLGRLINDHDVKLAGHLGEEDHEGGGFEAKEGGGDKERGQVKGEGQQEASYDDMHVEA